MTKRVAIYTRVSTDAQTTANQERELRAVAERAGWRVVRVYADQAVSGAKTRTARPAFKAMCEDTARRRFDMVAAWSVDRLGRSLQDLVGFLTEIHALRVDLYLHQQAIDTSSPAGRALFQMLGVFAEFERALIVDRVKAGLELPVPKVPNSDGLASMLKRRIRSGPLLPLAIEDFGRSRWNSVSALGPCKGSRPR